MSLIQHEKLLDDLTHYLGISRKWAGLLKAVNNVSQANPYNYHFQQVPYLMWVEQSTLNFPLLYLSCLYLYQYAKKHGCDTFLFASRDCCHMYKIFSKLFEKMKFNIHYFHCSRNMFEKATEHESKAYKDYVESLVKGRIDKTIFIDVHGTARRVVEYFTNFHEVPHCVLVSATCARYNRFPAACYEHYKKGRMINLAFDIRGNPIEMLNYDLVGTLQDFNSRQGPVRDALEYPVALVEPYHRCMKFLIEHLVPLNDDDLTYDLNELAHLISKICLNIKDNRVVISQSIRHIKKHAPAESKSKTRKG